MPTKPTFAQDFKEMMDKWDEVMAWVKKNNAGISDADAYEVTKRIFDKNLKLTPSNARLSAICDRELARVGLAQEPTVFAKIYALVRNGTKDAAAITKATGFDFSSRSAKQALYDHGIVYNEKTHQVSEY